jgi:hypothetical protein
MLAFPDVEKAVVAYLKNAFADVHVATKKVAADADQPSEQIVVQFAYNREQNTVTRIGSLTLDVYANDYATANDLALLVEANIRGLAGGVVKKVEVAVGPVRVAEETEQEKRSLDVQLTVAGFEI